MIDRHRWALAPATRWADERTLVGGDPFRSVRLTPRGAKFVRAVLDVARAPRTAAEHALLDRLCRGNLLLRPTASAGAGGDVTLVVPARAAASDVQRVLDSAPKVPAIVVDDGSPVPLEGLLRHWSSLQIIRNDSPKGPGAARNLGAAAAATTWIAFADADTEPPTGWIAALLANAGSAAAIAPRVVSSRVAGASGSFERAVCALDMGSRPGYVSPSGVLAYVPSAALLVRRDAFLALQGFDETIRVGEDVDLIWRLADEGVYYEPSVVVEHAPRPSLRSALARRAAYGQSGGALAARHPRLMHHGAFPLAAAAPWLLAAAGAPRLAAAAAATHLALAPRATPQLPRGAAYRVAAYGQLRTAYGLSRNLTRPLLPVTAAALVAGTGIGRRAAMIGAVAALAARRSPTGAAWQLLDDAAYSVGAWQAAVRTRRPSLLLPRFRMMGRS